MLRLSTLSRSSASINVRFTAPGHANPYFLDRASFVDPSHPATKLTLRNVPAFVCPQFTLRAFPNAILQEPADFVPINPLLATGLARARAPTHTAKRPQAWWSKLNIAGTQPVQTVQNARTNGRRQTWTTFHEKEGYRQWNSLDATKRHVKFVAARQIADARLAAFAERGRHNVGLLFHIPKKTTSKSSVIRRRLRSKMTAAINLVVSRNADAIDMAEGDKPRPATLYPPLKLVSRDLQEGEHFILQDWTYLAIPGLAVYRMPMLNLIQAVRKALVSLNHQSNRLESSWPASPKDNARSSRTLSVDSRPPSLHRPSKVVTTRTDTNHPHCSHSACRTSSHSQGPSSPEPAKDENRSTRLYSSHPVILPHSIRDLNK